MPDSVLGHSAELALTQGQVTTRIAKWLVSTRSRNLSHVLLPLRLPSARNHSSERDWIFPNRYGAAMLWLFLGVVAVGAFLHSQTFSIEVALLLALLVWLSRELSARRKTAPLG